MAVMVMHVCFLQFPVCLFSTILKKMKGLLTLFTFTGFPHKLTLPDPVITLDDTKRKFNLSAVNSPGRSLSDSVTQSPYSHSHSPSTPLSHSAPPAP